jgi:CDP-glucose 4,6-dehydratase
MEDLASGVTATFWSGKRVLVTGHTGFKGAWLCLWLEQLGAEVVGVSSGRATEPSLFELASVGDGVESVEADVRDAARMRDILRERRPEVVIHLAAQSLVRRSYEQPLETYEVNTLGTANVLEAVRGADDVRAVVCISTDKVYENREWLWAYREDEPLGGHDPYSSSKAGAELVVAAYRASFFEDGGHGAAVASARAGNVIGGGDWADDRLIPDIMRAAIDGRPAAVRNPHSIRPWQHVLNPLSGYLMLAERLWEDDGFASAWNFGPADEDARPVEWILERLAAHWGEGLSWELDKGDHAHEATYLKVDSSKARALLGWTPRWDLDGALAAVAEWYRAYQSGDDVRELTLAQIERYSGSTMRTSSQSGAAPSSASSK